MQVKRLYFDLAVAFSLLFLYLTKFYEYLPAPVQLVSIKVLLISIGFMHAHITRKLAFPSVDWDREGINAKTILVIALYIVFVYAYAIGG